MYVLVARTNCSRLFTADGVSIESSSARALAGPPFVFQPTTPGRLSRRSLPEPRRERSLEGGEPALEVGGGGHAVLGVLHRGVVFLEQEEEPDLAGAEVSQRLADGDEVLERFGHFEAIDGEVARVKEVVDAPARGGRGEK
eukprot:scaffold20357_cov79-Isochrysis_galbana.AAC.1